MRNLYQAVALLALAPLCGFSSDILFQGTFQTDNQVQYFLVTVDASATISIQSFGYAGGTALSTVVPSGGFAPDVTIFSEVGGSFTQILSDNGGNCGVVNTDPNTGNCDDPYISTFLQDATYIVGLSVWDNTPVDGSFDDGYNQANNPGFTCAEGSTSGNFCDVTDATFPSRTGNWAIEFSGFDQAVEEIAPEPSTCALLALAGVSLLWRKRRHLVA